MSSYDPSAGPQRSTQFLLTSVPSFFDNHRPLRDWIMSVGGSVRSVLLVHRTALVTMSHADAALKVLAAFKHFSSLLSDNELDGSKSVPMFSAHAVPTSREIPMPPSTMDSETSKMLGDSLYKAFLRHKEKKNEGVDTSSSRMSTGPESKSIDPTTTATPGVEAADEEEEDPLTAPAVLEAVRIFREQLRVQQGSKAVRRQALVETAIGQLLPKMRLRMKEEQANSTRVAPMPRGPPGAPLKPPALPPPPPNDGPPLAGLPPPPPPGAIVAPRGVSNKPAWMTQQEQQQAAQQEPPAKRVKVDLSDLNTCFGSVTGAASKAALRHFIAERLVQSLGEEEASLIDFCYSHVIAQKSVVALQSELTDVLEQDAAGFVQQVHEKTITLS